MNLNFGVTSIATPCMPISNVSIPMFPNRFAFYMELRLILILRLYRMWGNVQRDGRPVEYRWRRLFNAAKSA